MEVLQKVVKSEGMVFGSCSSLSFSFSGSIQELAGHEDLSTTQRIHVSPSAIENAIRLLELSAVRGDSGETIPISLENVNRQRGKWLRGPATAITDGVPLPTARRGGRMNRHRAESATGRWRLQFTTESLPQSALHMRVCAGCGRSAPRRRHSATVGLLVARRLPDEKRHGIW
jgi:hypothetical protein